MDSTTPEASALANLVRHPHLNEAEFDELGISVPSARARSNRVPGRANAKAACSANPLSAVWDQGRERIQDQRRVIFHAQAILEVARRSLQDSDDWQLRMNLETAYEQLDRAASELDTICENITKGWEVSHD